MIYTISSSQFHEIYLRTYDYLKRILKNMKILLTFLFLISLINSYYSFGHYKFSSYYNDYGNYKNRNEVYTLIETSGYVKTLNIDNTIIYNKVCNHTHLDTIISNKDVVFFYICNNKIINESYLTPFNIAKSCIKNKVSRLLIISSSYNKIKRNEEDLVKGIYNKYNYQNHKNSDNNKNYLSYTIVKTGYIIGGRKRGCNEIEICTDYSKTGIITRADLIAVCINCIYNDDTKNTIFEVFNKNKNYRYIYINFYKYIINKYFKLSRSNDSNEEIDNNNNYTHLFLKLKSHGE